MGIFEKMKCITYYINDEIDVDETLIQDRNGNVTDFISDDDTLDEFLVLCKYGDFFNSIEQHWHTVNKSTPTSRAIKDETDKLFQIALKVFTMVSQESNFDYERNWEKGIVWYYEDEFMVGKKLSTIIKRSSEWKDFYKAYKRFKDDEVDVIGKDSQLVNLIKQFIIISKDFVEDVQS